MRGLLLIFFTINLVALSSCETASTAKEAEQEAVDAIHTAIDPPISHTDTTLSSLGDSLKADINNAAYKIKQHTKELSEAAKQKANEGVSKLKKEAQKIKDAAKAGADAAKEELKK